MISLYFVATTVTTVGYGDIVPVNGVERIFCHFIMLVGVLAFSFASGSLGSLITNYENSQASMKERLETLNKIKKQYNLSAPLFNELQVAIKFEFSK